MFRSIWAPCIVMNMLICNIIVSMVEIGSCYKVYCWKMYTLLYRHGGARGAMVIVLGNGHGNTSSNPRRDRWLFT